jgi:hypothetical protein
MGKVETLGPHLGTDPAVVNVQNEPAVGSICKVEVPHVLEGALVNDTTLGTRGWTTEGVAAVGDGRHLVDNVEGQSKQPLLRLAVGDCGLHLGLDSIPDIVERSLGGGELAAVVVEGGVDAELVVGAAIAEMQTGRDGEVCLERDRQLVEQALTGGGCVGDEYAGFGRVVYSVRRVDKLAHLQ